MGDVTRLRRVLVMITCCGPGVGADAARAFLADIDSGAFTLEAVGSDVFLRAVELDVRYADADLGLVDASVVAVTEFRRASTVFTLDHADLRLALPGHVKLEPPEGAAWRT